MRYIRQASTALLGGVVLFFTGCSDNHGHKIDTDNHFEYNGSSHQKITNTKTHLVISSSEEENKSKLIPIQKDTSLNTQEEVIIVTDTSVQMKEESDALISKLQNERDEAIKVTLELKKANDELNSKIPTLNEKIAVSAAALISANKLVASDDSKISTLAKEKDEAISLTLKMKEELQTLEDEKKDTLASYEDLKTKNSELENKIIALDAKIVELLKTEDEDNSTLELLKKQSDEDKEKTLNELAKVKDELSAQQSKLQEVEDNYKKEIEALKVSLDEANNQKIGIKTKLAASAAALLAAQQLTANKDENVTNIIHQRDDAIKVALQMKEDAEKKDANYEELNKKVEQLTSELEETKATSSEQNQTASTALDTANKELEAKNTELEKLKNQIDELSKNKEDSRVKIAATIAALMQAEKLGSTKNDEINKLNDELKQQKESCHKVEEKLSKKLVIGEILNTFKLSKVEFETDSDVLTKKSTQLLDKVSEIMKEHTEYKYRIQGHTDSQGKEEHNLELSNERAKSVQNYLIGKSVDARLLSYEGFGSSKPIADNGTKEGRLANRRVVFEIVN